MKRPEGAILVILGVLFATPSFLGDLLRPDILLRYRIVESTTPSDLVEWLEKVNREVSWRPGGPLNLGDEYSELALALNDPVAKKLDAIGHGIEKVVIELVNQSDFAISGAKLRIDGIFRLWGAAVEGTFITASESTRLLTDVVKGYQNDSVILSSLPTLPPEASLELVLYGTVAVFEPTLNVTGHTSALKKLQLVEDSWILHLYLNPEILLIWLPIPIWILAFLFFAFLQRLRRISIGRAVPATLYDTGCNLAKKGRPDDAMVLLREAVAVGYSNRAHAKQDTDLKDLRERKDFRELFSDSNDET